jgi:hypothetical protein
MADISSHIAQCHHRRENLLHRRCQCPQLYVAVSLTGMTRRTLALSRCLDEPLRPLLDHRSLRHLRMLQVV